MLLLKGFFRKKSTIIYIIIYSIIFSAIISIFSLIKFNEEYLKSVYSKTSFLMVTSSKECYDEIKDNKNVVKIERFIIFEPDNECTTFKHSSYTVVTNDSIIDYNSGQIGDSRLAWEDFMEFDYIMIFSDKEKDFKLKDNEIALSLSGIENVNQDVKNNLIGKNLTFIYNNQKEEFKIQNYYNSVNKEMTIPDNKFNELINYSKYSYKVYVDDYLNLGESISNLKDSINTEDVEVDGIQSVNALEEGDRVFQARDLIDLFKIISFFSIIIIVIIFIIVSRNVYVDEKKIAKIERVIGFNKLQTKKLSFLKVVTLNFSSFIIAIIISTIINFLVNTFVNFTMPVLNLDIIFFIFVYLVILTVFTSIFNLDICF